MCASLRFIFRRCWCPFVLLNSVKYISFGRLLFQVPQSTAACTVIHKTHFRLIVQQNTLRLVLVFSLFWAFYMTRFVWNHLNLRRRHSHTRHTAKRRKEEKKSRPKFSKQIQRHTAHESTVYQLMLTERYVAQTQRSNYTINANMQQRASSCLPFRIIAIFCSCCSLFVPFSVRAHARVCVCVCVSV